VAATDPEAAAATSAEVEVPAAEAPPAEAPAGQPAEPAVDDEDTTERRRPRWGWRRRRGAAEPEPATQDREPPKHVRVLPPPEPVVERELDPWERGFDYDLDEPDDELDAEELPARRSPR
jgi:hypothetical protein